MNRLTTIGVLWCWLCLPTVAGAQSTPRVIVVVPAVEVNERPDVRSASMMTAFSGAVFDALGKRGDWYWVALPPDADGTSRAGYVMARDINVVTGTEGQSRQGPQATAPLAAPRPVAQVQALEQVPAAGRPATPRPSPALQPVPPSGAVQAAPLAGTIPDAQVAPPGSPSDQRSGPQVPNPQARNGLWFNAGIGGGSAGCLECGGLRELVAGGGVSLGGTLGKHVLLGGGIAASSKYYEEEGVTVTVGTFDVRVRVYPSAASGFFITGGLGLGIISGEAAVAVGTGLGKVTYSETGGGALIGVGWDVRVSRNVSLTPFYNKFSVGTANATVDVNQFGLGITIH